MNNSKQIAQTIIEQIEETYTMTVGNQKVSNMKLIGAHHATYGTKGVVFGVRAKGKGFNKIQITLNDEDLYNVEFWNVKPNPNYQCKLIKNFESIGFEELGRLIVEETIY